MELRKFSAVSISSVDAPPMVISEAMAGFSNASQGTFSVSVLCHEGLARNHPLTLIDVSQLNASHCPENELYDVPLLNSLEPIPIVEELS